MRRPITMFAVAALLLGLAAPVSATHGIDPTFRTEDVYFKCRNTTKVYQVDWLANLGNSSTYAPWEAEPPEESVADGAGCGALDVGGVTNLFYSPVFHGSFEGNLRDMTVQLHHLLFGHTRSSGPQELAVHLEIDGVAVFPPGAGAGGRVMVEPVEGNSGATELFEFSITNLGFAEDVLDEDGNVVAVEHGGLAREDGDGTRSYEILLMVGGATYPRPGAWVWDTTEVPSGIVFNAEELADATVAATLPR